MINWVLTILNFKNGLIWFFKATFLLKFFAKNAPFSSLKSVRAENERQSLLSPPNEHSLSINDEEMSFCAKISADIELKHSDGQDSLTIQTHIRTWKRSRTTTSVQWLGDKQHKLICSLKTRRWARQSHLTAKKFVASSLNFRILSRSFRSWILCTWLAATLPSSENDVLLWMCSFLVYAFR